VSFFSERKRAAERAVIQASDGCAEQTRQRLRRRADGEAGKSEASRGCESAEAAERHQKKEGP